MKTQSKQKSKSKLILKLILGFIIGISFGFGIGKMVKGNSKVTSAIEKSIQKNCDCESVKSDFSAVGFQFSKENGLSTEQLNLTLKNCDYKFSAKTEARRLNNLLKAEVENYSSIDIIELVFQSKAEKELVTIKDGKIL